MCDSAAAAAVSGSRWAADEGSDDDEQQQQHKGRAKPSWAAAAAEEEAEGPEGGRRRGEAAAKQRAIMQQLKEQLTNILLEVTDKMFGKAGGGGVGWNWPKEGGACVVSVWCWWWWLRGGGSVAHILSRKSCRQQLTMPVGVVDMGRVSVGWGGGCSSSSVACRLCWLIGVLPPPSLPPVQCPHPLCLHPCAVPLLTAVCLTCSTLAALSYHPPPPLSPPTRFR